MHKDPVSRAQYQRDYWIKNKAIKSKKGKQYWLKSKYGITPEEHNQLLINHDFRCALCKRHMTEFKHGLGVDHCHETGKIRGMLCMPCNTSLGYFGDTPEALTKVLSYLTQNTGV